MEYRNGDVSYPYVSMHKELLATTADSLVSEPEGLPLPLSNTITCNKNYILVNSKKGDSQWKKIVSFHEFVVFVLPFLHYYYFTCSSGSMTFSQ